MPKITLKAARVNAELTLDEVAEIMGKSKQTIMNWENGKADIRYSDLLKLSEIYEMPVKYIRMPGERTISHNARFSDIKRSQFGRIIGFNR